MRFNNLVIYSFSGLTTFGYTTFISEPTVKCYPTFISEPTVKFYHFCSLPISIFRRSCISFHFVVKFYEYLNMLEIFNPILLDPTLKYWLHRMFATHMLSEFFNPHSGHQPLRSYGCQPRRTVFPPGDTRRSAIRSAGSDNRFQPKLKTTDHRHALDIPHCSGSCAVSVPSRKYHDLMP